MEIDWNEAPEWADRVISNSVTERQYWANKDGYQYIEGGVIYIFKNTGGSINDFNIISAHPDKWQEGEERMNVIPQNGNDGAAYDAVNHPEHYQSESGIECIDAIRASLGLDGFVAYCRGNAIKYAWRSGKKAKHAEDLRKAAWYLERAAKELDK